MAAAAAAPLALLLAALCARVARGQTYTNENIAGIRAYSAFAGAPSASQFAPYTYRPPPASVTGCVGVGGTCVPVAVAGSAEAGYWLTRAGVPYWIKCVAAARRVRRVRRVAPFAARLVCLTHSSHARPPPPRTPPARGAPHVSRGALAPRAVRQRKA